jgi:hypothetical protein
LSEAVPTLVALAVVAANDRLLVVKSSHGQLELPGLEVGEANATAGGLSRLMSTLGLDQKARQTLYLQNLRVRKQQATPVMGVIHIIRLAKPQLFDIPDSRYETISSLTENEMASPATRSVARWLLRTQTNPRHQ